MTAASSVSKGRTGYRLVALFVVLVWSTFWFFFGLAAGIGEHLSLRGVLIHILVPGVVFVLCTFFAMVKPRPGGILLIVIGGLVAVGYPSLYGHMPWSVIKFMLLAMALPPLVAGFLFLLYAKSIPSSGDSVGDLPSAP
jgi:hypothetical protein